MEKVKLTKEQAEAIEKFLGHSNPNKEGLLRLHATGGWVGSHYGSLNSLNLEKMAKALYIGYEIEPEKSKFKVGSKVLHPDQLKGFSVSEIIEIPAPLKAPNVYILRDQGERVFHGNELRHATPEEIYWLETLGRDSVNDYRTGDVMVTTCGQTFLRGKEMTTGGYEYSGIYPAESFKPLPER